MNQSTRVRESSEKQAVLYLALELSRKEWKLAFALETGQKPRLRTIAAGDIAKLQEEIRGAEQKFGVKDCRVVSCYEAGRDGFWLDRQLKALEIDNIVVDAGSMEVSRRFRRAKTDKLDVQGLLSRLIRFWQGEKKVWSVVRVPTVEQEDGRQLSRELETLKQERTRHRNRIVGLLVSQGVLELKAAKDFLEQLETVSLWDGSSVPPGLSAAGLAPLPSMSPWGSDTHVPGYPMTPLVGARSRFRSPVPPRSAIHAGDHAPSAKLGGRVQDAVAPSALQQLDELFNR